MCITEVLLYSSTFTVADMSLMPFSELAGYQAGQDTGDFLKNAAVAARDFYCDLYGKYPTYFTGLTTVEPFNSFNKGINDNLCRNVPKPAAEDGPTDGAGGQCVGVRYNLVYRIVTKNPSGTIVDTGVRTLASGQFGPISAKQTKLLSAGTSDQFAFGFKFFSGSNPVAFTSVQSASNQKELVNAYWRAVRADNQPDTCGNPPDRPRIKPSPEELVKPVPVNNPNGNPVIVPVFLPIVNVFRPTIQVGIGPINIDIGPDTVNVTPRIDLPDVNINNPEVNFPINLPPGAPPQRPNVTINGGGGDCPDPCPDPLEFVDVVVEVGVCTKDGPNWKFAKENRTLKVIKQEEAATKEQYRQLLPLVRAECLDRNKRIAGTPELIAADVSEIGKRSFTVNLPDGCLSVYLDVVGELPTGVSLYSLQSNNEEQGRIGNISLAVQGGPQGGGYQDSEPGWIWTRRTWLDVSSPTTKSKQVRLNLKPGITWALYDSGEREQVRSYS